MDLNQMKLFTLLGAAMGMKPRTRQIGGGQERAQERAQERLAAKRKANAATYKNMPERPPSRQVLRAMARRKAKDHRHGVKMAAMKNKWPGGAAVVS